MCNDYRLLTDAATIFSDFSELKVKIRFPEGKPNPEAREDIKITDTAPIVRTINGEPKAAIWCNADGVGRGAASASCLIVFPSDPAGSGAAGRSATQAGGGRGWVVSAPI